MNPYVIDQTHFNGQKRACLPSSRQQRGATLIVSLIILAVVTVLGVASMRSSNMELKMAASTKDRSIAFQNAESVLRSVERDLSGVGAYKMDELRSNCSGHARCFNTTCNNGLCFTGMFPENGYKDGCSIADVTGNVKQMWKENTAVWNDTNKHRIKEVPDSRTNGVTHEVKYIIEFMCYVVRDDLNVINVQEVRNSMLPLYRVTVRANGESNRANVMLQSIFRSSEGQ